MARAEGGGGGCGGGGGGVSIGLTCLLLGELLIGGCVCVEGGGIYSVFSRGRVLTHPGATLFLATIQRDNRQHIELFHYIIFLIRHPLLR